MMNITLFVIRDGVLCFVMFAFIRLNLAIEAMESYFMEVECRLKVTYVR